MNKRFILLLSIFLLTACQSKESKQVENLGVSQEEEQEEEIIDEEPVDIEVEFGDTVEVVLDDKEYKLTVNSDKKVIQNYSNQDWMNEDYNFLVLQVKLENTGTENLSDWLFSKKNIKLYDKNLTEISYSELQQINFADQSKKAFGAGEVLPGGINEGELVLYFDKGIELGQLIYTPNWTGYYDMGKYTFKF